MDLNNNIQSNNKKNNFIDNNKKNILTIIIISSVFGFLAGSIISVSFYFQFKTYLNDRLSQNLSDQEQKYISQINQEEKTIKAIKDVSPAVVSIVISKDVPIFEQYYYNPFQEFGPSPFGYMIPQYRQNGTEKKEVGSGTGFIISEDGIILTNKHVVLEDTAEYTVYMNDGRKFTAKVLDKDPVEDLAIIKIEQEKIENENGELILESFPFAKLGDSDNLQIGQTVITIGNALGEFNNTVSVGVISGLGRTITASGGEGFIETLESAIQTDAAINRGNSGGPLVNLEGEVIGINTAMVQDAQSIGFAILINKAKRDIEQIKTIGKIVYPFLGVTYVLVNESVQEEYDLSVDYGALVIGDKGKSAIWPDSSAQKAGLKEMDVILEFGGEKINQDNSLAKLISKYGPNDKVNLKYLRDGEEKNVEVELGERKE
ncbi:MAG: trypsin-like peptidase domain-containing protein [Candidatus Nealsonbacteria bacterium]